AAQLSLSTTTITNICDELIKMGLIAEGGIEEISGRRRVGRPRAALRLVKDARYAIGVQVGVGIYRIAIANLRAEIISHQSYTFDRASSPRDIFQRISGQIESLIEENQLDRQRIVG